MWETTNTAYKAVLKEWFKGTGGGPGIDAAFQTWGDDKLDKYNVDIETYDHTNVANCPIVLYQNYAKNKVPFLTVIRMWDKMSDYLLSAKHGPLTIGSGELGFNDDHEDDSPDVSVNDRSIKSRKQTSPKKGNLHRPLIDLKTYLV